jgi:hypothetical protein
MLVGADVVDMIVGILLGFGVGSIVGELLVVE